MRLIDADELLEFMRNRIDMQDLYLPIHLKDLVVDEMPTAYNVDAVVEELEELNNKGSASKTERLITKAIVNKAIEIVRNGGGKNDD